MKHSCKNCHFLCKTYRSENGDTHIYSWGVDDRKNGCVKTHYSVGCYLGVWDSGIDPSLEKDIPKIIDVPRKNVCFFTENIPGMSFKAAKVLQERRSENAQLKKSNLYTQIGLWIAALALMVNVVIEIFKD